eukprot:TRINITY_DN1538_c0_g1_i6.p1 TRINITY_DN1538_c0_g1~~TRINITY_DN1538_c0_g1_i6.p1  ORF type:complete len:389 (+),score=55.40 TRINITY_DN1538_c0_g1_i6:243-1409(+)
MYQVVRNPYGERQSGCGCCCAVVIVLVTLVFCVSLLPFLYDDQMGMTFPYLMSSVANEEVETAYAEFVSTYSKSYATKEEAEKRKKIFAINYGKIVENNKNPSRTSTLTVYDHADLTDEEFSERYLLEPMESEHTKRWKLETGKEPNADLEINWNEKGKVTTVKDQGMCGSCWTFSSISVIETIVAIKDNKSPERYSEQQIVDCIHNYQSNGCQGGEPSDAFKYVQKNGVSLEKDYPYTARDEKCKANDVKHVIKISGHVNISEGSNTEMEKIIQTRSMAVCLAAGYHAFRFYKSGVVTTGCPAININHAVTVVGAGTLDNIPYWLVRNSWGKNWGDNGHIRLMRTADKTEGMCGVNLFAQYVLYKDCLLYTSPSPRDLSTSRMPSSA